MEFKKLRKKLSAILCSVIMVGGSNISNHVAMAGGISLGGNGIIKSNLDNINSFNGIKISNEELSSWKNTFSLCTSKNTEEIVLGSNEGSVEFSGHVYAFDVEHDSETANVKIYFEKDESNGSVFAISFGSVKFGILPFTYFVYLMRTAGITADKFVAFDEMGDPDKIKFLDVISRAFLGSAGDASEGYEDACNWFLQYLDTYTAPDKKGFDEPEVDDASNDTKPISIYAIDFFKKTNPKWQNGELVFQQDPPGETLSDEGDKVNEDELKKSKISPLWLIPGIGVPSIIVGGIIAGALANKHKKGDSKINDTQKEVSNKVFLGKKRGFNTSENAKTMVANKTSNNRRNANPRPNQRKSLDNRGFKRVKKQGL